MRSPINPSSRATYCCAFWSRIIVKDYVVAAYLSDRLFLALGHILTKISSKDFQPQATKNTEYIEDGCQLIFAISLLGNYFCPYRTQVYILHQVLRVLPWAKETIGLSARCCLCIKNHMSSLLQNILRSNILKKISPKDFLPLGNQKKSVSSVDYSEYPPWIIQSDFRET